MAAKTVMAGWGVSLVKLCEDGSVEGEIKTGEIQKFVAGDPDMDPKKREALESLYRNFGSPSEIKPVVE